MAYADGEKTKIPCALCGSELENVQSPVNQPYGALALRSEGHYGTTSFDPMDGSYLELNVCDECVKRLRDESKIIHVSADGSEEIWSE